MKLWLPLAALLGSARADLAGGWGKAEQLEPYAGPDPAVAAAGGGFAEYLRAAGAYLDHMLWTRQANDSTVLQDGIVQVGGIAPNVTDWYKLTADTNETVWVTLSVCSQLTPNSVSNATRLYNTSEVPVLTLYVSNTTTTELANSSDMVLEESFVQEAVYGLANITVTLDNYTTSIVQQSVYVAVEAPGDTGNWTGSWTYQVAASTSGPVHEYHDEKFLFVRDTDSQAALLSTGNITWAKNSSILQDFEIYLQPQEYSTTRMSLERSYCAMTELPAMINLQNTDRSMTTTGLGTDPKEQFYVRNLNKSSTYDAFLVLPAENGQGGTTYPMTQLRTKTSDTCQVIYNLDFCQQVAYAVPANQERYSAIQLAALYDSQAAALYENFTRTLEQYSCNNPSLAERFSVLADCDTCSQAYKNWLCAVLIPRCGDISLNRSYTVARYNESRNQFIQNEISPGSYSEIKPCIDLCWSLASSCPTDLGFTCPKDNDTAYRMGYGERSDSELITCNAPGVDFFVSAATPPAAASALVALAVALAASACML